MHGNSSELEHRFGAESAYSDLTPRSLPTNVTSSAQDSGKINAAIKKFMRLRRKDPLAWSMLLSMAPTLGISEDDLADAAARYAPTVVDPLDFVGEWQTCDSKSSFSIFQESKNLIYKETFSNGDVLIGHLLPHARPGAHPSVSAELYIGQPDETEGELFGGITLYRSSDVPAKLTYSTRDYVNEWEPYGDSVVARWLEPTVACREIPHFFLPMLSTTEVRQDAKTSSSGSDWETSSSPSCESSMPDPSRCRSASAAGSHSYAHLGLESSSVLDAPHASDVPLPRANWLSGATTKTQPDTAGTFSRGARRKREDEERTLPGQSSSDKYSACASSDRHGSWSDWGWRDWASSSWDEKPQPEVPEPNRSEPSIQNDFAQQIGDGRQLGACAPGVPASESARGGTFAPAPRGGVSGTIGRGGATAAGAGARLPARAGGPLLGAGVSGRCGAPATAPSAQGRGGAPAPSKILFKAPPARLLAAASAALGGNFGPGGRGGTSALPPKGGASTVAPPAPTSRKAKKKKKSNKIDASLLRQHEAEAEERERRRRPKTTAPPAENTYKLDPEGKHCTKDPNSVYHMRKIPPWALPAANQPAAPASSALGVGAPTNPNSRDNQYRVQGPQSGAAPVLAEEYAKAVSGWSRLR